MKVHRLHLLCLIAIISYGDLIHGDQSPKPHNPYDPVIYPADSCPDIDQNKEWDYVIVGAGPAGATLGRRLAEDKHVQVLILEAGADPVPSTDIPANFLYDPEYTWNLTTQPKDLQCLGRPNKVCPYTFGKFVGGSSVINQMMYLRGNHRDYDEWQEANCPGWGWSDIFPYFKKLENFEDPRHQANPDWEYHNKGGPFTTTPSQEDPQVASFKKKLVKALDNQKVPYTNDINGRTQIGYGEITAHFEATGYRGNVAKAYLLNIPDNLKICKYAVVHKLTVVDKTVTGVEYVYNGTESRVAKAKEYILSAGPISSPQILERSGIGRKDVLDKAGVEQIHDLNGVGENLYEQSGNLGCAFFMNINTQVARNPLSLTMTSFAIFLNVTDYSKPVPDIQAIFTPGLDAIISIFTPEITKQYKDLLQTDLSYILMVPMVVLRQSNTGYVHIATTNPLDSALFQPNQITSEYENKTHGEACRLIRRAMADPEISSFEAKPIILNECKGYEFNSDEEIVCHAGYTTFPFFHIAGTTKMGPASDNMAVVDTKMRVHGIKKLRIVDLGIMPAVPRGNTEIPTIAVSEMAADIIKGKLQR